jgi:hypothetical protein
MYLPFIYSVPSSRTPHNQKKKKGELNDFNIVRWFLDGLIMNPRTRWRCSLFSDVAQMTLALLTSRKCMTPPELQEKNKFMLSCLLRTLSIPIVQYVEIMLRTKRKRGILMLAVNAFATPRAPPSSRPNTRCR